MKVYGVTGGIQQNVDTEEITFMCGEVVVDSKTALSVE